MRDHNAVNYVHVEGAEDWPQPTVTYSTTEDPIELEFEDFDPRLDFNQEVVDNLYGIVRWSKAGNDEVMRLLDHGHITLKEYWLIIQGKTTATLSKPEFE